MRYATNNQLDSDELLAAINKHFAETPTEVVLEKLRAAESFQQDQGPVYQWNFTVDGGRINSLTYPVSEILFTDLSMPMHARYLQEYSMAMMETYTFVYPQSNKNEFEYALAA